MFRLASRECAAGDRLTQSRERSSKVNGRPSGRSRVYARRSPEEASHEFEEALWLQRQVDDVQPAGRSQSRIAGPDHDQVGIAERPERPTTSARTIMDVRGHDDDGMGRPGAGVVGFGPTKVCEPPHGEPVGLQKGDHRAPKTGSLVNDEHLGRHGP